MELDDVMAKEDLISETGNSTSSTAMKMGRDTAREESGCTMGKGSSGWIEWGFRKLLEFIEII